MAAEHTCELRAWRGRPPARPPRRWPRARPPADTVFPRSEHHAHAAARPPPGGDSRGGWHQPGKSKGANTPPPPARAHRRKPKRDPGRARRFQGPGACVQPGRRGSPQPRRGRRGREARSPATTSRSGDQVARPGLPSPGVRAPGQTQRGSLSAWISIPPRFLSGQPLQGRRTGSRPEHRLLSLCPDPPPLPGLRPRTDSAREGSPEARMPAAPGRPFAPRRERPCGGAGEGLEALTSRPRNARAASSRCSRGPGPPAAGARRRRSGGAVRPT